jgi:hypothetical protein
MVIHRQLSIAGQKVNACTLTSIAVIDAILSGSDHPLEIGKRIEKAQTDSQERYTENSLGVSNGGGILVDDAYTAYFSSHFIKPVRHELTASSQDINAADLIKCRDSYETVEEFMYWNEGHIDIVQAICPGVDWGNINEQELNVLLSMGGSQSLKGQFLDVIGRLSCEGITILAEGHTISVTKREATYYSYDSLTTQLSTTNDTNEMVDHIIHKLSVNHAKAATVHRFTPAATLEQRSKKEELNTKDVDRRKVTRITDQLAILKNKITELRDGNYHDAAKAAQTIYDEVNKLVQEYVSNEIDANKLIDDSKTVITGNRSELETFRGFKLKKVGEVLVNLLILIGSLGTSYLATGRFTLFVAKTDSAKKICDLERSISEMTYTTVL